MCIDLTEEVWVSVRQFEAPNAPRSLPLESGFTADVAYRVLGLHCPSETSEAYLVLCNDRDEMWFVSNRHFRIVNGADNRCPQRAVAMNGHLPRVSLK